MRMERKPRGQGREAEDIKQIVSRGSAVTLPEASWGGKEDDEGCSASWGRAKRCSAGAVVVSQVSGDAVNLKSTRAVLGALSQRPLAFGQLSELFPGGPSYEGLCPHSLFQKFTVGKKELSCLYPPWTWMRGLKSGPLCVLHGGSQEDHSLGLTPETLVTTLATILSRYVCDLGQLLRPSVPQFPYL